MCGSIMHTVFCTAQVNVCFWISLIRVFAQLLSIPLLGQHKMKLIAHYYPHMQGKGSSQSEVRGYV